MGWCFHHLIFAKCVGVSTSRGWKFVMGSTDLCPKDRGSFVILSTCARAPFPFRNPATLVGFPAPSLSCFRDATFLSTPATTIVWSCRKTYPSLSRDRWLPVSYLKGWDSRPLLRPSEVQLGRPQYVRRSGSGPTPGIAYEAPKTKRTSLSKGRAEAARRRRRRMHALP